MAESGSTHNRIQSLSERRDRARQGLHRSDAAMNRAMRAHLEWILECEALDMWRGEGRRSFAEWLAAERGITTWAARRRINAAHALPRLPKIEAAFLDGLLSLEKVLELCRFATAETEKRLVSWARRVTPSAIRRKGDLENRRSEQEAIDSDRSRYLHYWWCDEGGLGFEGCALRIKVQ